MPFRRKKRYNRSRRKRSNGLAKAKKDIKWLKKNVEFKFKDSEESAIQCNTTGAITPLATDAIVQGDSASERVGNEVTARRYHIRGYFYNTNGTPADCVVRVIIFRDKSPQGAAPGITELLVTGSLYAVSPYVIQESPRFKVYADYTFSMDTTQHSLIPFKFTQKVNHQVKWASGSVGEPNFNGWYMATMSNIAGVIDAPRVLIYDRFSYCDS